MNRFKYKILISICIVFFMLPLASQAAIIYFEPEQGAYGLGDEFSINIKLDITQNCVNTIEASIAFSNDIANLVDFSTGESFLDIWVEKPSTGDMDKINETGVLYFAGGIPGGYCGKIPGDPGESNIVGTMHFRIPTFSVSNNEEDVISLEFLAKTRALINDGLGTEDALIKKNAQYSFSDENSFPKTEWQDRLKNDKTPPEPFIIELQQNPKVYNNLYYIIFNTNDKQTGVDHYEVLEIRPGEEIDVKTEQSIIDLLTNKKAKAPSWKLAATPYLLEDQSLQSVIKVKAIDKAGNQRVVELIPNVKFPSVKTYSIWPLFMLLLLITAILIVIFIFIHKYIRRKKNDIQKDI